MKLKATTTRHLREWLSSGLMTAAEWRGLITLHGKSADAVDFFVWTLAEYDVLLHSGDEFAMVENVCRKLRRPAPRHAAGWLKMMGAIAKGLEAVDNAFAAVPRPSLSAEERSAGFGKSYGLFGVVDAIATRQGVADDVVKGMTVATVIGKMTIIADKVASEKKYSRICNSRFSRR